MTALYARLDKQGYRVLCGRTEPGRPPCGGELGTVEIAATAGVRPTAPDGVSCVALWDYSPRLEDASIRSPVWSLRRRRRLRPGQAHERRHSGDVPQLPVTVICARCGAPRVVDWDHLRTGLTT